MYTSCCFTGHRELGYDFDEALLYRLVENLIKHGTTEFYCGMAKGFDMVAAECVIYFKAKYPFVKLYACQPFADHMNSFGKILKPRYKKILDSCDEVFVVQEKYDLGCMYKRNRFMVERSQVVVSYLRKPTGGTAYTVRYAKEMGIDVIDI